MTAKQNERLHLLNEIYITVMKINSTDLEAQLDVTKNTFNVRVFENKDKESQRMYSSSINWYRYNLENLDITYHDQMVKNMKNILKELREYL